MDDFCQTFEPDFKGKLLEDGTTKRNKPSSLALSEVMTIIVLFHFSGYRTFKHYYCHLVCKHLSWAFPKLVSYNRFVELMPSALLPLASYLQTRKGSCTGISFIDSTPVKVCHNRRINSNKVFKEVARRGKNSIDWFFGFKIHLVVNEVGELLAIKLTAGNVDDRVPVPEMIKGLFGKLFGDRGYISQKLFELLFGQGIELITKIKKNMKNKLMSLFDKLMLRKRAIIETINDQLKNVSQIEHSRHRSVANFLVNVVAALIAYTHREKKPSLNIRINELTPLSSVVL
jgi:hypothetical protein